ncbi:MAG: hypothetical protein HOO90_11950 [Methylotenera sp.]|uniref:hypothetical protein n=1 Tax=Methylotenera sp. TaxID=2051956 RepID=UPI0017CDE91A|nr:hypothetical protein [Methylotenera sp.]NOU26228.1 hypothetical protein [Methylotenera sp.]
MINIKKFLTLILLGLMLSLPAWAKDVALEQASVSDARRDYENANADYESITNAIQIQEKNLAEGQARLKKLQSEQAEAEIKRADAKAQLEKKQKELERAWNNSQ